MVSKKKIKALASLLNNATSDIKMIRSILLDIKTDEEADELIEYINNSDNPSIQDINWESLKITAPRKGIII